MIVAAAQLSLLPIAPIILLPFAIIFFVIVFPIWGAALGVLGLFLLIFRGLNAITRGALAGPTNGIHKAFRWVLTFGGFVRLGEAKKET
jgi:uncharacterized membrane protein